MEKKANSSGGLFQSLFGGLFGKKDADSEKRKIIKGISKRYNKCKYNKFYKYNSNSMTPAFPGLFYDVYRIVSPAQKIFESYKNQNIYKKIVISASLSEEMKQIEDSLSEANLLNLAKEIPVDRLKNQVEERLTAFNDYFTSDRLTKIEQIYKLLMSFKDFCTFDFYFMLKKFNKSLSENSFPQGVHFDQINAEYVAEDLKELTDIIYSMPENIDWTPLFEVLKIMRGNSPVSLNVWKKIAAKMSSIKHSGALPLIIQMITNDPSYSVMPRNTVTTITESYIDSMRSEATNVIDKLIKQENQKKTTNSLIELFGDKPVDLLKYYTENGSQELKAKQLSTFKYCHALNYLKAFMIYFVKTDLHNFYDIVVVRGKWESPTLCSPVSNAYHSLTAVSDKITAFDEELNVSKATGMKIKTLMPKASRDNSSRNIINRLVGDANDSANECIMNSLRGIITIGKTIKSLVDDLSKTKPEMLTNWKEIEHFCDEPIREYLIRLYKKIYQFTTLIQTSLKESE